MLNIRLEAIVMNSSGKAVLYDAHTGVVLFEATDEAYHLLDPEELARKIALQAGTEIPVAKVKQDEFKDGDTVIFVKDITARELYGNEDKRIVLRKGTEAVVMDYQREIVKSYGFNLVVRITNGNRWMVKSEWVRKA